jgi:hypothetical protein
MNILINCEIVISRLNYVFVLVKCFISLDLN